MIEIGSTLDGVYTIKKSIGSGGTGEIYLAYHHRLQKDVVIKMIKSNFVENDSFNVRAEVDILKSLRHQYIPQVYDFYQEDSRIYTVMDYIDGYTLDDYVKNNWIMDEDTVAKWFMQLCEVLDYIHSRRPAIIHSDIKPLNIMIGNDGNAYLIDFNISFCEDVADIQGVSMQYASHEQIVRAMAIQSHMQIDSVRVDTRSDLYSLAASFYYLVTGKEPYDGIADIEPAGSYMLPYGKGLIRVIDKGMQQDPARRYQTAGKMLKELKKRNHYTTSYRVMWVGIVSIILISSIMVGVICGSLYKENQKKIAIECINECAILEDYYSALEYEDVIDYELNKNIIDKYKNYFNQNEDQLAYVYNLLGNSYYNLNDYGEAVNYFEKALEYAKAVSYYGDYAVALAKDGNTAKAAYVLDEAEKHGLMDDCLDEVKAEIYMAEHDYKGAEEIFLSIIKSGDEIVRYRTVLAISQIYKEQERYEELNTILENVVFSYKYRDIIYKLRAEVYMLTANSENREKIRKQYYENVIAMYESVGNKNIFTVSDEVNIAVAKESIGDIAGAQELVNHIIKTYPDNYLGYLYRSYIVAHANSGRRVSENIIIEIQNDYDKAKELYHRAGYNMYDADITSIGNLIEGLR